MGRTKNQLEKTKLTRSGDLVFALKYGEEGIKNKFLSLRALKWWLTNLESQQDGSHGLTHAEIDDYLQSVNDYPSSISREIQSRIEMLRSSQQHLQQELLEIKFSSTEEPKELHSELRKIEEEISSFLRIEEWINVELDEFGNDADSPETKSFEDPRFPIFLAYQKLKSELGRPPFRREVESIEGLGPTGRAVSKAVERMKLPLGDKRIHSQLQKGLNEIRATYRDNSDIQTAARTFKKLFSKLTIKSPEVDRLKTQLKDAPFDRVLSIIQNKNAQKLMELEVESLTTVGGVPFEFSIETISNLKPGDRLCQSRALIGSVKVHSIFQALRAVSILWNSIHIWELDIRWLKIGRASDYSLALDCLLLSLTKNAKNENSASAWVSSLSKLNDARDLLKSVWSRIYLQEITPQCFLEIEEGVTVLLNLFSNDELAENANCAQLSEIDLDFKLLISFLEPYDWVIKGEDYGFDSRLTD